MPYPVTVRVEPLLRNRNRLTVGFRLLLAIPHLILVGGVGISFALRSGRGGGTSFGTETGVLGVVAYLLAIVSWVLIVIGRRQPQGIRDFTRFYMRWRVRALSYMMLLRDEYPPFGDAPYPSSIEIAEPALPRNRVTVGFRILLAIPHFIALFFVLFAWWIVSVVAWVAILIGGAYPDGLYPFGTGALQWLLRVEAYMLLLVDDYPPFSLT
jgi:hypothetical protein